MSKLDHRPQIQAPAADSVWGGPVRPNCASYQRNTTLCMPNLDHRKCVPYQGDTSFCISSLGHRPQIQPPSAGQVWRARVRRKYAHNKMKRTRCMSNLPHRPQIQLPTASLVGEARFRRNCAPYHVNIIVCMTNLDHRPQIQPPTLGLVWVAPRGMQHFACRILTTDHTFNHQPRA